MPGGIGHYDQSRLFHFDHFTSQINKVENFYHHYYDECFYDE